MNRLLVLLILIGMGQTISAQYVYTIKADSVKITNSCDTAELIIENHTQTVPGFLYNKGRGRTEFREGVIKINESAYLIGADTLYIPKVNANNGTSLVNGNIVLGNDPGSTAAQLMNTREIPLNGNNLVFTGAGKIGIGANNPRDLLELGTPIASNDSATANLRFTYTAEPTRYTDVIWNRFSGDPQSHIMGFSLTNKNTTINPLQLTADSKIYLSGSVICKGDGRGTLDLVNTTTFTDANMIVLGFPDGFHHHLIKASYNGASPQLNKIQFYLMTAGDTVSVPAANPLNLLGDGNAIFNGNIGVRSTAPSAHIHVGAGTSSGGTAPIKLTAGTILAMPEDGAIEYDGNELYLTSNAVRYKLGKILEGQLTTNFGGISLGAFTSAIATLTVAGAQPGDVVNVSANNGAANPSSIIITAYVTSANLVTLQAYNASNSAVNLESDTYKVRVIK